MAVAQLSYIISVAVLHCRNFNSYDYTCVLQSSSGIQSLKLIHARIITAGLRQNPFLAAKLVSRYADLGPPYMTDARKLFDRLLRRDAVLYNVLIRGYATSGPPAEALAIYNQMICSVTVRSNVYTFPFVLKACAVSGEPKVGRAIHAHAIRAGAAGDLFVSNALITFYAKSAMGNCARTVFDKMPQRDLVTWNSIISGYTQTGHASEALVLLRRMLPEVIPDYVTLLAALPACTAASSIADGLWIHSHSLKNKLGTETAVGSGLIEMYANCGCLKVACKVFDFIPHKNLVVYTSMIRAFGMHGLASAALEMFHKMLATGIKPDSICFVSILSACSHGGLVEDAIKIFDEMDSKYGVEKEQVHYACVVDLLGRAGKLSSAWEFISRMSSEPRRDVLGAFLGACRAQKNIDLGEEYAKKLLLLDPDNAGRYSMLAKVYADFGRWEEVARLRKAMRDRGVRKPLGCSMVEVAAKLHTFGVEDEAHPMSEAIYDTLEQLHGMVDEVEKAQI